MKYVSENTRQWIKAFLLSVLLGGAQAALAAGGLSSAESSLKDAILSFYGIVAILAGLAMLVTAVWGYFGNKTLKDVVEVCGWIFLAGASLAVAKAVFDWGKQASFS